MANTDIKGKTKDEQNVKDLNKDRIINAGWSHVEAWGKRKVSNTDIGSENLR